MKRKMKKGPKVILALLFAVLIVGGGFWVVNNTDIANSIAPTGNTGSSRPSAETRRAAQDPGVETINVCVVTWGGYAGGEYFNGGFAASTDSRYYREYGILVDFRVMDDFQASRDAWKSGECHLLWATIDAFTTEAAHLQAAGYEPVFLFQADWSRGGDAIVVRRGISSMADLRRKRVAVAYGTPSHTFVLRMLEAAGMRVSDIELIDTGDALEAANVFKSGRADAAVVWSPDDDACLKAVTGSSVLVSTKEATHIIADGFFVNRPYLESHRRELTSLVEGWLRGAAEINNNPSARAGAVEVLAKGLNVPDTEASNAIGRVRLTTYGDNLLFFGLEHRPGFMTGEKLFRESADLYRQNGYTELVPSVPSWRSITDTSILRDINLTGSQHAAEVGQRFAAPTKTEAQAQEITSKQLTVTFPTGSAVLGDNAKALIDVGFVPTAQSFAGARIRIEGNTDKTGTLAVNMRLSRQRAQAVADYLAREYGFDRNRFIVVGNGPDNPVCFEDTPDCYARNRRTDFELIAQ